MMIVAASTIDRDGLFCNQERCCVTVATAASLTL